MEKLEPCAWRVLKKLKILPYDLTLGYISKRIESRVSKRYLYTHDYSNIIYNSQDVEVTQVFIDS